MSTTTLPRPAVEAGPVLRRPRVDARRLVRGRADDPRWVRPALLLILAVAALLCLWDFTSGGLSNTYYAAAVKSASVSWKAWFFGSLDPGSFITVDKPPLSIWLMGLSARAFGFSSFSMLLPEAVATVAAVGLLYTTVRRLFGAVPGLIAAVALATTPITVAVARVNNPDALLVLLLVASAYAVVRALESGRTRHLVACGALVGLAFMTKMMQGWMVVPALALTYLVAGPPALPARLKQLAAAGVTMVVVSAAWPVAVSVWPGAKPYIGGSTNGSVWNLIFGYNGFGRLTGNETGAGGGGGPTFGGAAGLSRMFNEQVGGQIAWLLPLALVSLAAGFWLTRRAPRTDRRRAGWLLFGAWALVLIAVFSSQKGIFHPYYVSALAPAVAALSGAGVVMLARWATRSWTGAAVTVATLAAEGWLAVELLGRTAGFAPWLSVVIPVAAAAGGLAVLALRTGRRSDPRLAAIAAVAVAIALAAGPVSYSLATVGRQISGGNVLAGPASVESGGRGGGAPGGDRGTVSAATTRYLESHQGSAKYLVAAVGSQTTANIIVSTGKPVVTIGGFNGNDPAPTVAQLAAMVAKGQLRYVLVSSGGGFGGGPGGGFTGGPGGGPGGGTSSQSIATWVKAHGTAVTGLSTSGATLYRVSA